MVREMSGFFGKGIVVLRYLIGCSVKFRLRVILSCLSSSSFSSFCLSSFSSYFFSFVSLFFLALLGFLPPLSWFPVSPSSLVFRLFFLLLLGFLSPHYPLCCFSSSFLSSSLSFLVLLLLFLAFPLVPPFVLVSINDFSLPHYFLFCPSFFI